MNDIFKLYTSPIKYRLTLCTPTKHELTILKEASDINYKCSLVETSELSFNIPYELNGQKNENYDIVQGLYLILMEQYVENEDTVLSRKYFTITNPKKNGNDKSDKALKCYSLEHRLNDKLVRGYSGVKKIYRTQQELDNYSVNEKDKKIWTTLDDYRRSGILNYIVELFPQWSVGHVDDLLKDKSRDLTASDNTGLDFLRNTVQKSFNCIFVFDTVNMTINVFDEDNLGGFSGFYITDRNYIDSISEDLDFDKITTKLIVSGKDNISINGVNPLGTDFVYDFSYFKNTNYMSTDLISKITEYENKITTKEVEYGKLVDDQNEYNKQLIELQSDLILLNGELSQLEDTKDINIKMGYSLAQINSEINAKKNQIASKQNEINTMKSNINTTVGKLKAISDSLKLENNFTTDECSILDVYTFEKKHNDNNFYLDTDLFIECKKVIKTINCPEIKTDVKVKDFLKLVEYDYDWDKLVLGSIVKGRHHKLGMDIELRLMGYSHGNDLSLELSNNIKNKDAASKLGEVLTNAMSTTNNYNSNKYKFDIGVNAKNDLDDYKSNPIDASKQKIVSKNVVIDDRGVLLKEDEKSWIKDIGGRLVATQDGGETYFPIMTTWGVMAETLTGRIDDQKVTIDGYMRIVDYDDDGDGIVNNSLLLDGNRVDDNAIQYNDVLWTSENIVNQIYNRTQVVDNGDFGDSYIDDVINGGEFGDLKDYIYCDSGDFEDDTVYMVLEGGEF